MNVKVRCSGFKCPKDIQFGTQSGSIAKNTEAAASIYKGILKIMFGIYTPLSADGC